MTAALAPFDFQGQTVRVVTDEHGEPWFIARDVCLVLDLPNVGQAVSRLADDEKGVTTDDTLGGVQQFVTISEPGLYRLIFTSRKAEAEAFRRWVTHEVLPSIRRTGGYATVTELPTVVDAGMLRQIAAAMEAKDARIAELEPAAAVAQTLIGAEGDYSLREAAQVLSRDHGIDTGQNRLLQHLRSIGWVDSRGYPYQSQIQTGRIAVRTRTYDHPHTGEPQISTQTRVTAKGLAWLHQNWPRPGGLAVVS
jgi:prophage antirepressor-like protein